MDSNSLLDGMISAPARSAAIRSAVDHITVFSEKKNTAICLISAFILKTVRALHKKAHPKICKHHNRKTCDAQYGERLPCPPLLKLRMKIKRI